MDGPAKSKSPVGRWLISLIPLFRSGFNMFQPSQIGGAGFRWPIHPRVIKCLLIVLGNTYQHSGMVCWGFVFFLTGKTACHGGPSCVPFK